MSPATAVARRSPASRRGPARSAKKRPFRLIQNTKALGSRRLGEIIAISILVVSLFAIVVGHSMLAQGQLRLGNLSTELAKEQSIHSTTVLKVAGLETPARVSSEAGSLHLVQPTQIRQLPSAPLDAPLPTLKITPDPKKP